MKKLFLTYLVLGLFCAGSLSSCFDDKGTSGEITRDLTIDTTGLNNIANGIEISNGATLTLTPKLTGIPESDLTYLWECSVATFNSTNALFFEIGKTKNLEKLVNWAPAVDPYIVAFHATDTKTGVVYNQQFKVLVTSATGDGVIVVDSKDGQNSDISLLRAPCLSSGYTGATLYKRNLYSTNNGRNFQGLISKIYYARQDAAGTKFLIYAMSDKTLETLNPATYSTEQTFDQLFLVPPSAGKAFQTLQIDAAATYFVYGGEIYHMERVRSDFKFGDPITYVSPSLPDAIKKTANEHLIAARNCSLFFFDSSLGKFFGTLGFGCGYKLFEVTQGKGINAYNPAALQNYEEVGSCAGNAKQQLHLLKNTADQSICIYGMFCTYQEDEDKWNYESTSKWSTTGCPEIASAFTFEGCGSNSVIYYATSSKVYTAVLTSTSASASASASIGFTAPAGETITCVKLFREAWSNTENSPSSGAPMPEHENQLMVATYNASSNAGTLHVLPISGASGTLGASDPARTFTGFGKITALGTQGKQ